MQFRLHHIVKNHKISAKFMRDFFYIRKKIKSKFLFEGEIEKRRKKFSEIVSWHHFLFRYWIGDWTIVKIAHISLCGSMWKPVASNLMVSVISCTCQNHSNSLHLNETQFHAIHTSLTTRFNTIFFQQRIYPYPNINTHLCWHFFFHFLYCFCSTNKQRKRMQNERNLIDLLKDFALIDNDADTQFYL